jgi:hypothetical protein
LPLCIDHEYLAVEIQEHLIVGVPTSPFITRLSAIDNQCKISAYSFDPANLAIATRRQPDAARTSEESPLF